MKHLLKNPLTQWFSWLIKSRQILRRNAGKHLDIGYLALIHDSTFGRYNRVCPGAVLSSVAMGDMSYIGARSRIARTTIGKFTCIGPEVLAGLGRHPSRGFVSSHPAFFSPCLRTGRSFVSEEVFTEFAPITIGHDVWIGARAILLDGVTIGTGSIVGAGAVVASEIPPYAVAVGVPARVVRMRFDGGQVAQLLASAWWDRDLDELEHFASSFSHIEAFSRWRDENAGHMK